jgi:Tfp pilus assembly protein PilZ
VVAPDVLCCDAPSSRAVGRRIAALGVGVRTLAPDALGAALRHAAPRAVVLDTDLTEPELEALLRAVAPPLERGATTGLAAGPPPGAARRARLREAGVTLALFEPVDDATLRHQVNRVFLGERHGGRARRELRAPVPASAIVVEPETGTRIQATLYTLSEGGAFVETRRLAQLGGRVELRVALGASGLRLRATVVHVHPPGEAGRAPAGMGLRFDADAPEAAALAARIRARCQALSV